LESIFHLLLTDMPGQKKTNILHQLPAPCKQEEGVARNLLVSYMAGGLSPAEKRKFERHCIFCLQCRYTLEIIQHLTYFQPQIGEEWQTLASLDTAARIGRWDRKRKSRLTSQRVVAR
jgi:hypothetical protein